VVVRNLADYDQAFGVTISTDLQPDDKADVEVAS